MAQEHTEYKYRQRPPMTPEEREKAFGPLMDKYDATFERLGKYEEPKKQIVIQHNPTAPTHTVPFI